MDEPVSQQEEPEGQTVSPAEVWKHLDQATRDRAMDLFAHLAYKFVVAQREKAEEDKGVYLGCDEEDYGGAH